MQLYIKYPENRSENCTGAFDEEIFKTYTHLFIWQSNFAGEDHPELRKI